MGELTLWGLIHFKYKLWKMDEFEAEPDSPMHFFNKENLAYTVQFIPADDGSIARLVAFGNDPFHKVKMPSLTAAQMKAFEGKYRLKEDPDNLILISARDRNLVVKQLWDGKETIVDPLADFFFYNNVQKYPLYFSKDTTGAIIGVLILNKDHFEKLKD